MTAAPLLGLVLAGGRSRRMGRDKAALEFHGESALTRGVRLLNAHCAEVYVSVRPGDSDPLRARYACIADRHGSVGPADGIASAQRTQPAAAWLVLACDLPKLTDATVASLIRARDVAADATAFASAHDGLPEPLCAIYEPRSAAYIAAQLAAGVRCPRKMLLALDTHLLPPVNDDLDNVNTPDDWQRVQGAQR